MIDFFIVLVYFILIFVTAISGAKLTKSITSDEYFLSGRSLKWPSIALSTIATNVQGYQFLGMMGSAYLFGLAQANLEINAMQGLLIAAFVFVPVFLKHKITTITQFIKLKLGSRIALCYSLVSIVLFSTITLGAALFWGAYAADMVFGDLLTFISSNQIYRISILIIILGLFSAVYTYLGGLSAVVKTDVIQFFVLMSGGIIILFVSVYQIGGWSQLFILTPEKMHLHLPANHEKLPWTHMFGLFFLNINYWCANQTIMQRSIAAKSLKHAQTGLMVGGVLKYFMAVVIIIPGIALYSIIDQPLVDPDMAFPYIVKNFIPVGLRGLILCGLFASLMSTVDSTFNSIATMWSVDIYSVYINKKATDFEKVQSGRRAIIFSLFTALLMGLFLLFLKFENPGSAFTHTLNELRYYINCGIVVLICSAILLIKPKHSFILFAFVITLPANIVIQLLFPEINYFVRAFFVIILGLIIAILFNKNKIVNRLELISYDSDFIKKSGIVLAFSLIALHIIFH
jgi:SSS family solute:Na+ symporter